MIVIVIEIGTAWAWPVYLASSILSYLLAGDKEAAMLFVIFFGYYPILKAIIEKHSKGFTAYFFKFALFNAAMVAGYFLSIYVLLVPRDSFVLFGVYLPAVFLVAGNAVFLIYDYALSTLVLAYYRRFHAAVSQMFRRK